MNVFLPLILFISDPAATSKNTEQFSKYYVPDRPLTPPFPDGLNGGRIVIIPPEETYETLIGNSVVLPPRPIGVWLPREYDCDDFKDHDFPVLLVHDGQNAMSDLDSWTGASWRMMGAITRLAERRMLRNATPPVVVLLESARDDLIPGVVRRRHLEYADTANLFAQAHVDFCAKTVLPLVQQKFRVSCEAEHTFAMGSSLGGQASLHLLLRYPDLFGGAACMSPAFSLPTVASVAAQRDKLRGKRIYMDIGGDIDQKKVAWFDVMDHMTNAHWWNPGYWWLDTQLQPSVDAMSFALTVAGIQHRYEKFPGGRHNERAWSNRIHRPLLHLLGK